MNFIIFEPDPIVRMDLREILVTSFADCQVTEREAPSQVDIALESLQPNTTLICHGGLLDGHPDLRQLAKAAAQTGHQVVVSGEQRDLEFPARFIGHPFTTEMVVQTITGTEPDQTG